ncbi:LOW QUALITY PROTEIN: hypothetical protein U9M48_037703 [Paspalum notatum var. saurae]|uniref:Uncharacterized protein n=1 Tax=Paspalum notatum var. saurae TaxID=547442 RepID=A0AAQ3UJR3_PASNO
MLSFLLEWLAGRWVEDLHLGKRLRQHGLEGLRRPLFGEHGGQESTGVHVAVAHRDHVPGSQQRSQLDGVLLPGDEGEVGRQELLHHRRDHHVGAQPVLLQERPVVDAVRLVVEEPGAVVGREVEDVAVLGALPRRPQHGARGGQHPDLVADGGGLAGLEVTRRKGVGREASTGCALGVVTTGRSGALADSCVSVRTWQWSSRLCVMSSRSGGGKRSSTPRAFTLGFLLAPSKSHGAPKSRLPTTRGSTRMRRGGASNSCCCCCCTSHTQLLISRYVNLSVTCFVVVVVVLLTPRMLVVVPDEEDDGAEELLLPPAAAATIDLGSARRIQAGVDRRRRHGEEAAATAVAGLKGSWRRTAMATAHRCKMQKFRPARPVTVS